MFGESNLSKFMVWVDCCWSNLEDSRGRESMTAGCTIVRQIVKARMRQIIGLEWLRLTTDGSGLI